MNDLNPILYTIRPGDTLYNIAIQYGTTVQELMDTNLALNPYDLRVGQQIYIYPRYNSYSNDYWISINHVNLLTQMNLMWLEHIMWTRMFLISVAESLGDLEPTKARLLENPKDIANVFRKYYGSSIANKIQDLLTEHLVIGGDLIVALKNGNQKLATELNTKWYKNADDMAESFSKINPFYTKEEVRKMLYDHLKLSTFSFIFYKPLLELFSYFLFFLLYKPFHLFLLLAFLYLLEFFLTFLLNIQILCHILLQVFLF